MQALPQEHSGRSPTLEQGPMGPWGPKGAKVTRVPWPRAPGPLKALWKGAQGPTGTLGDLGAPEGP